MIRPIMTGVWVCAATMGSAYLGAHWQKPANEQSTHNAGHGASNELTPVRTRMISVPIVGDGAIRGYVVAQLAFTAPANLMKTMSVKPDMYVLDEAFQLIFSGEMI